jgi:hypothetical protein
MSKLVNIKREIMYMKVNYVGEYIFIFVWTCVLWSLMVLLMNKNYKWTGLV